jgi:hypothetical protein
MTALENMMIDLFKPPLNKRGAKPEKTVLVGAHYPSEVRRALFLLQAETGKTAKQLLGEAINDLCAKDEPPPAL